jgi:hypothetical protein
VTDDILARIDATVDQRCACGCGVLLSPTSPSGWYASERCQQRWTEQHADVGADAGSSVRVTGDVYFAPAGSLLETGLIGYATTDGLVQLAADTTVTFGLVGTAPRDPAPQPQPTEGHANGGTLGQLFGMDIVTSPQMPRGVLTVADLHTAMQAGPIVYIHSDALSPPPTPRSWWRRHGRPADHP